MTFIGPEPPLEPRPAPDARALGLMVAELERFREAALRAAQPSGLSRIARPLPEDLSDDEKRVVGLLNRVRELVLSQPAAGKAITSFLVAEGRRFAGSDEGAAWLECLRDAPEVERLRQIWEAMTLNVFDDIEDAEDVPDAWADLIADLAAIGNVNRIVTALLPEGLI
jgi:hypothetical protein